MELSKNARIILEKRYLMRNENGQLVETPEQLFKRVAKNIASVDGLHYYRKRIRKIERNEQKDFSQLINSKIIKKMFKNDPRIKKREQQFYDLLSNFDFLPNTPALLNAGRQLQQLAACFVLPLEDNLDSIFRTIHMSAMTHQSGGGTGFNFSKLRPRGSFMRRTEGMAAGPVAFLKIFDAATEQVKQGGKRRGANMGILSVHHPDIEEFVTLKTFEPVRNFNLSVAVTDQFMNAVNRNKTFPIIDPIKGKREEVKAKKIFDLICKTAWQIGDPGLIFIDEMNRKHPLKHTKIDATNPCVTADTLIPTERGLMKIEEIVDSKENILITIDTKALGIESSDQRLVEVHSAIKTGIKETVKVTTKSGFELCATEDHKILTTRGWKEIKDLSEEDHILIQSDGGVFNNNTKISFKNEFANHWSKDLGIISGWLIGDGWLREGKNCRVGFTFGVDDNDIFQSLKPKINNMYGKNIKEIIRENGVIHFSFHSKSFVEFFKKLGVKPVKAREKEVPDKLFTASRDAVTGFLQGLFSADGTIAADNKKKSNYVRLTSKSIKLLKGVQILLLNLGIMSKIYERHRKNAGLFRYTTTKGELREYKSDGLLYELQISKNMIPLFLEKIGFLNNKHKNKIDHLKKVGYYKTKFEDKIKTIKPNGKKTVYDLTEPVSNSFIANGIIIHNCGEQPLLPYESCNLGSINLAHHVKDKKIDWDKLKKTVHLSVHFLDNMIDASNYVYKEIKVASRKSRKIGLGIMGLADMFFQLEIPYNSNQALKTAEKLCKFLHHEAEKSSQKLAKLRRPFPEYKRSIYRWKKRRNAAITTVSPTGTVSLIADCSQSIEPVFALAYSRTALEKEKLTELNKYLLLALKKHGLYKKNIINHIKKTGSIQNIKEIPQQLKKIFVTAFEVSPEYHLKMQAVFQRYYSESSVSKTVNIPHSATINDVRKIYKQAYEFKCKGITIYRYGSKPEQILSFGMGKKYVGKGK